MLHVRRLDPALRISNLKRLARSAGRDVARCLRRACGRQACPNDRRLMSAIPADEPLPIRYHAVRAPSL